MTDTTGETSGRLMGWKEIGAYLGKSARTVQRWEQALGLPVHRIKTDHDGQIIFAMRDEIDAWLASRATADITATAPAPAGLARATRENASTRRHWMGLSVMAAAALLFGTAGVMWRTGLMPASTTDSSLQRGESGITEPVVYFLTLTGLVVYDERSDTTVRSIRLPDDAPFSTLHGGRLAADGSELTFATRGATGTVSLGLRTERWSDWTPLAGHRLQEATTSVDGRTAITLDLDGRAFISDRTTRMVLGEVLLPLHAYDVAPFGDQNHFLVTARNEGTVSVVDSRTFSVQSRIRAGDSIGRIAVTTDGRRMFVTNHYQDAVSCVDLVKGERTGTTPVGTRPWAVSLSPDERRLYVSDRDSDSVSIVDTQTCGRVGTITPVFGRGQIGGLTLGAQGRRLYVASYHEGRVAVFDVSDAPTNYTRLRDIRVPTVLSGLVASPAARR